MTFTTYSYRSAPITPIREPVYAPRVATVEGVDVKLPLVHDQVTGNHETSHRSKEHAVARQHRQERRGRVDKPPGVDNDAENGCEICSPSDVEISRERRGQVEPAGQGIPRDVDTNLGDDETQPCEKARRSRTSRLILGQEPRKERRRVPDRLATEAVLRGRRDQDADQRAEDAVDRERHGLPQDGMPWLRRKAGVVVLVEDARCDRPDGRHDAVYHQPRHAVRSPGVGQGGAGRYGVAEAGGPHRCEGPDEEYDEEDEGDAAREAEELLETVRTDPYNRQANHAEDDIGDELCGCHARVRRDRIWDMGLEARVPREQDEVYTLAAHPSCEAVPVTTGQCVSFEKIASRTQTRLE